MSRIRIKFCGLTRPEDAVCAAELGVDAVGVVFYQPSSRAVTVEQARRVLDALPAFVTTVALFLDAGHNEVDRVLNELPIDLLQFHGNETPEFCEMFERPYIKALPMADPVDLNASAQRFINARALLLDAHAKGEAGGQGKTFDWAHTRLARPIVLAGGLSPDNIQTAIQTVRPWAVDVSSGIESSPGIKDHERMTQFVNEVNRASC